MSKSHPHLGRINQWWQCCEYCKSPRLCALPSDKAHGATKNISDNASAVSRDCRSKALATAPTSNPYLCNPLLPLLHPQAHEKAAMRTAREPMRTAAERKDCPKWRAWENGYYFLYDWSNSGKIIFGSFLNSFNEISSFSIFFMTSGKSFKANFSSFFIATRIPLTSSQYAFA